MNRVIRVVVCLTSVLSVSLNCSMHVVATEGPNLASSAVVSDQRQFEILSEPSENAPVARLRSVHRQQVVEHFKWTTRYRDENACSNSLRLLAPAVLLASLGLGVDQTAVGPDKGATMLLTLSAIPAVAALGVWGFGLITWSKTVTTTDTVLEATPVPIGLYDGTKHVVTLEPASNGIAEFDLREHLSSLGGSPRDMTLTARMENADTICRTFDVTQGTFEAAVEQHRAEIERQAHELREQQLAQERAEREERERVARAAAAVRAQLDRAVASLSDWDRAQLVTRFMYADAGFQLLIMEQFSASYGIRSYGDFLNLPLRSQVDIVRQLARLGGGEGYGASMFLQSLLSLPAYLTEKVLR